MKSKRGDIRIGISGWIYPGWRGVFYRAGLVQKRELEFASRQVSSIEINGSFYSLQRPSSYTAWHAATPGGFIFSVKAPRFITHMKKLRDVETPLANFFASGVLNLREKLGPFLWQLPPNLGFDAARLESFFSLLPRTTTEAAVLAASHDHHVAGRSEIPKLPSRPLRHALEVRHESFRCEAFVSLLRRHKIALVIADTAGKWPYMEDITADFLYVRLHGDKVLYVSGYTPKALAKWTEKVLAWAAGDTPPEPVLIAPPAAEKPRDVFVYFDNDVKVRAPRDAKNLIRRVTRASEAVLTK